MARLIVKWRYIKPGAPKQGEHYVDYIATREGVEIEGEKWKDEPATKEQEKLVNRLIADFPDCKDSFEYQNYLSAKTKYTATTFIDKAIEENVDRIGKKENYIGYIAMRPRVEKSGAHGLFSYSDESINLSKVAKEVGNHDGVVWTTVISLKREDATKLGYDNLSAWKTLLRAKSQDLANAMGIPITDMKWYAAFHNESGHPHVHLVSYSTGKEPYMTRQGLENLKAAYAHEIFKNDLYEIYEKQTEYRDELRTESKEKIAEIIRRINGKKYDNETIELMLKTLAEKLQKHKGKKVYGYLPKDVKNLVNGVIDELMRDSDLQKLYELWYEQRENVLKTYRDKMPARLSLSANEEFKSVRNAVIAEAMNLSFSEISMVEETTAEPTDKEIEKSEKKPRKDYKTAWQFYDWAKACMDKNGENYNPEFAVKLFTEAANCGITVAKYKLGKLFLSGDGVEKDIAKAVEWLKQSAAGENEFAEYALGRLYLQGKEIEKDTITAEKYLLKAVSRGNKYAAYLLGKEYLNGENFGKNTQKAVGYLKLAAEKNFEPAEYVLGKLYLQGEEVGKDVATAEKYLLNAAEHGNKFAEYILGKEYLRGENFPKDVQKAIDYLKRAAEKGFDFAEYELGKIYLFGNDAPKDTETALEYLNSAAANGNEYAQALLMQRELFQKQSIHLAIGRLFAYLVKALQEKTEAEFDVKIARTDRKLRRRIAEKKQAQGLKLE